MKEERREGGGRSEEGGKREEGRREGQRRKGGGRGRGGVGKCQVMWAATHLLLGERSGRE